MSKPPKISIPVLGHGNIAQIQMTADDAVKVLRYATRLRNANDALSRENALLKSQLLAELKRARKAGRA